MHSMLVGGQQQTGDEQTAAMALLDCVVEARVLLVLMLSCEILGAAEAERARGSVHVGAEVAAVWVAMLMNVLARLADFLLKWIAAYLAPNSTVVAVAGGMSGAAV